LEAIRHLSRALETLRLLPESEERDRQELVAQTAIGTPLMSVHGYAAPETGAAYGRARVLSLRVGDRQGMYAALSGEYPYHFVRGDLPMMRQVSQETRATAEALDDDSFRMVAHRLAGMDAMYVGEFDRALKEFGTLADRYDAKLHRPPLVHYVHDPKIIGIAYLAILHWIQGRPDEGRRWSEASIAYTEELRHANQTAFGHVYGGAGFHELNYDVAAVEKHVKAILDVAEQYSLFYFRLSGLVLQGWLIAMGGDATKGAARMRRTIDERFALGVGWYQVRYLCMLAEVYLAHADAAAGLEAIERARRHIDSHGEAMWQAEVHRLDGELRLLAGQGAEAAEACLRKALSVARRQGAKSFELRASMSLARLQGERGAREVARAQLGAVVASLSQGFDTADYRRAAELLRALQ
jgi:predicted ATPase